MKDAINCSMSKEFTQIPNDLLRNPEISGKAKSIQCILLSNKDGWKSYINGLKNFMSEGETAIRSGLGELEQHGYLKRIRYRNKETKQWVGSFWAYTDTPSHFNIEEQKQQLEEQGLEMYLKEENPDVENPDVGNSDVENPGLIILNRNNIKKEKDQSSTSENNKNKYKITPPKFEKFWEMYPKKVDKGKAKTIWDRICQRKQNRPTWRELSLSLARQKKSERWQNKKFIPHPSTWLNQSRWLDDPSQMKSYDFNKNNSHQPYKEEDKEYTF